MSKLQVIHFSSNSDLPQSVRAKVPDAVGQTLLRQTLNNHLGQGKSEMSSYVQGYKALSDAGYAQDENQNWVQASQGGGPGGPEVGVEVPLAVGVDSTAMSKGGPGSGPRAGTGSPKQQLKDLQDVHDQLKDHSARTGNPSQAAEDSFVKGVTALGEHVENFSNKNAGALLNARKSMTNQIKNGHDALNESNKFSGPEKLWRVDTALSQYHTALMVAGKTLGSDWVGKSSPTLQQSHINRPIGSVEYEQNKEDEEKDDPGTQDVDPPPIIYFADAPTIQNPDDARNLNADNRGADHITASVPATDALEQEFKVDDPGTQDVDPPEQSYPFTPDYQMTKIEKIISGSSQIKLNPKGVLLAKRLGQRIAVKGCLDVLYSSPLNRGEETAEEILEACPHTTYAKPVPQLQPWHLGAFEGKEPNDVRDQIDFYIKHPDQQPQGNGKDGKPAETFNEAKQRQLTFWKAIYEDWTVDPTLKIGVVCHSRGLELLQAWVDADCPDDFELDEKDVINPDDAAHVSMMRWHKDNIKEIDLDIDDPLKPGVYPILHSLTNDDSDDGNEQLEGKKVEKYLPPIEVHRAAKLAYDAGIAVLDITAPLAEGEGLTETKIREIAKHFESVESATESETSRNAWGGKYYAHKWAARVLKKITTDQQKQFPSWIGVDLDGTIAEPLKSFDPLKIGPPIKERCDQVKQLIKEGKAVRIFTARVAHDPTGKIKEAIEEWCLEHLGKKLPVTNEKDPGMTMLYDDRARHPDMINKAGSGILISFMLDHVTADELKVPDGEDPSDMHMTLCYLGKINTLPMDKLPLLEKALEKFAQTYSPVSGEIAGPIRFPACVNTEGRDVCVASFENKSIQEFRKALLNKIEETGFKVQNTFSYTPHITLKYIQPDDAMPVQRISPIPVTFNKITLSVGTTKKEYELSGTQVAKSTKMMTGTIIEAVNMENNVMWVHVSCYDGNRYALFFDPLGNEIQIGDKLGWNETTCYWSSDDKNGGKDQVPLTRYQITSVKNWPEDWPIVGLNRNDPNQYTVLVGDDVGKDSGSHEGTWVTVNGQHILIGSDGKPIGGNPKALGRTVSVNVERARKSAVLTGKHEQDIADRAEIKLSKALGIPRTKNNSAFDLKNDDVGVEVKCMVTGKSDRVFMNNTAVGRKVAEATAEGIKTYTVVADMRGRSSAKYYVSEKLGSIRLGSMKAVSLSELKEMVKQ